MSHDSARARIAGLIVFATAASTVVLGGSAAAAPGALPVPGAGPTADGGATVTLVTGDRVTLGGPNGVSVRAAKGREHISFLRSTDEQGDVHVVPRDAARLVSAGRVDPRLFDVTELARIGYGDAGRKDVPLIVDYPGATPRTAGAKVVRELPAVGGVAIRAEKNARFWAGARESAQRIWLDGPVKASLDHSVPQIGAPRAWEAGHTGEGTTVAVLDTGIDATHPDLADAISDARDFSESESGPDDRFGHGTHVASIITGGGERYKGVAPDAKLLNGKVLDDGGSGAESWIIAGMEWAATSGADVINMSLGSPFPSDGTDPMSQAVNRLTEQTGALFVISAGNSGPGEASIGSPAAADAALTVGAVDREDQLAEFSSRGPRWEDGAIKPDITAPGVDIAAAGAAQGVIGDPVEDGYVSLSGTSMAAPHVAGAAAIVAGQHPDWTAEQLKSTLMASAKPHTDLTVFEQGAGRVDVGAAVEATVSASPASLSVGTTLWPHDDDEPIAKTLSYRNSGTEPVTLDLATEVTGPGGDAAPAGMFTVSPGQLTVPAGGTAEATLTTDTRVEAPDGLYSGVLTATAGDVVVRTPVAVNREVESYSVKLTFLDHDGKPTPEYGFRFVDIANPKAYLPYDESGTVVARLPKGRFYFESYVQTMRTETDWLTNDYVEPEFEVTGDAELVVDARDGKALNFRVDEPNAEEGRSVTAFLLDTDWGETGMMIMGGDFDGRSITPSTTTAGDRFTFNLEAELAEPDGTGEFPGFEGSPYLYHLRWSEQGRVPADLDRAFRNRDLAKVRSDHAQGKPGLLGVRNDVVSGVLPFSLTEFYTPNEPWYDYFYEAVDPREFPVTFLANATAKVYKKGKVVHEQWNKGVFGPAFPEAEYPLAARQGDELGVSVPLFADQAPFRDGPAYSAGTTELLRDGEVIYSEPYPAGGVFALPPEEATYTLRTSTDRSDVARLSTQVSAEWTFRSGHVPGEEPAAVPLLAVRFAPDLDSANTAPSGRFRFPVYVQRNGSATPGPVTTPAVEVSYDDGVSWAPVRVKRQGDRWVATVDHPAGASFASLRSSVSDRDGNASSQTILRAYALR